MALFPTGPLVRGPRPESPRRHGLLEVVQPQTPNDPHWMVGGVNWEDFLCTTVESFIDTCEPTTAFVKSGERDLNFCASDPFQIKGSFDCSVGGRVRQYTSGEAFEIARQRLLQWEGHELERIFWTGVTENGAINPSLSDGNDVCGLVTVDVTPGGTPIDPIAALATLESNLKDSIPNGGMIHVPFGLTNYLANFKLLREMDGRLYTPNGNSYVVGSGYPGSGPNNAPAAAGTTWMFATGPVAVWRSDVFMVPDNVSQSVDRSINDITVYAERYYAVGFSCAVFAVNVDLTCAC